MSWMWCTDCNLLVTGQGYGISKALPNPKKKYYAHLKIAVPCPVVFFLHKRAIILDYEQSIT